MQGYQIVNRIKARVAELGLTMTEFYRDCGISSGAVSQWRSGRTTPSMANLRNIAAYLGIPLSQLLEETENPASTNADGISEKLSTLSPVLRKQFVRFLALAKEDPDKAARFLEFAAQELESQR